MVLFFPPVKSGAQLFRGNALDSPKGAAESCVHAVYLHIRFDSNDCPCFANCFDSNDESHA